MSLSDSIIFELSRGVVRPFADWPDPTVPVFGAGVLHSLGQRRPLHLRGHVWTRDHRRDPPSKFASGHLYAPS